MGTIALHSRHAHCSLTPMSHALFAHLLQPEFDDMWEADVEDLLGAQAATAALTPEPAPRPFSLEVNSDRLLQQARDAFVATTNPDLPPALKREAILALRVPPAVRHLAGMLSEYDWSFVEQAKELRGYVVAKLLEETRSPDPRIRLKALELVGKLTEVGSFTTRVELVNTPVNASELEDRIRTKLASLLPRTIEVQDITATT